jgi:hypothetical protein
MPIPSKNASVELLTLAIRRRLADLKETYEALLHNDYTAAHARGVARARRRQGKRMKQQTFASIACAGLSVWIQVNCYLTFHRFVMIPVIFSALLLGCGLVLFERRKQ